MKLAAYLSHYVLYALMIVMPLLVGGCGRRPPTRSCLSGIRLPAILPQSDSLHTLLWNAHFDLAFVLFAVILLHVVAALFHALARRDGVFTAMAPVSTPREIAPTERRHLWETRDHSPFQVTDRNHTL